MKTRQQIFDELEYTSAHDVDERLVHEFYEEAFPHKSEFICNNWKWLNHSDFFDFKYPQVVLHEGIVAGQQSFTPYKALFNGKPYTGIWGQDLFVLKKYRGTLLTKKLITDVGNVSDISFAFLNQNSFNLLTKRFDWHHVKESYMHFFPLSPFRKKTWPLFIKTTSNTFSRFALKWFYKRFSVPVGDLSVEKVDKENIRSLITKTDKLSPNTIYGIYDYEKLDWRLLQSPYSDSYRIFTFKSLGISIAINLYLAEKEKKLDLMYIPPGASQREIRTIISSIAVWAINNNFHIFRYYTTDSSLSTFLKESLKSSLGNQLIMCYSKNQVLFEELKKAKWSWQIIDSDLEQF